MVAETMQPGQSISCVARRLDLGGILCDSVRHQGGLNAVAYRPTNIQDVTQAAHSRIGVQAGSSRVSAQLLTV